jgi:tRNA(Ile)-lysidine synthase
VREQVLTYIRERELLIAGDRVAVAVSGGADSVALLRVLLELRAELGIVLFVAHFNHELRGAESDADEQFVAELARQHDLPYFAGRANVREHAAGNKLSIEHAARELRYAWLMKLAQKDHFEAIATAHTFDDQAETVLMKFLRGAGTKGLAGIHPVLLREGIRIVRPLLETQRTEVEQYLASIRQPWREDKSNRDPSFARNRIRHELLPLLERDYNPNLRELLNEAAEVALAEEDYWQRKAESFLVQSNTSPGRIKLCYNVSHSDGLLAESLAMQRRVLKSLLERHGLPTDFHHVEALRRCAVGATSKVDLPGGWLAIREGDRLELKPPATQPASLVASYECLLPIPGKWVIPEARLTARATVIPADAAVDEAPGSLLCRDRLGHELTIRNWQPGDRFRPAHSGSEEKLKRLFSEKRIPAEQRPLWPVALAGSQIVWVRGFPVAHDYAWVPGSGDAVRIEVLPQE